MSLCACVCVCLVCGSQKAESKPKVYGLKKQLGWLPSLCGCDPVHTECCSCYLLALCLVYPNSNERETCLVLRVPTRIW